VKIRDCVRTRYRLLTDKSQSIVSRIERETANGELTELKRKLPQIMPERETGGQMKDTINDI